MCAVLQPSASITCSIKQAVSRTSMFMPQRSQTHHCRQGCSPVLCTDAHADSSALPDCSLTVPSAWCTWPACERQPCSAWGSWMQSRLPLLSARQHSRAGWQKHWMPDLQQHMQQWSPTGNGYVVTGTPCSATVTSENVMHACRALAHWQCCWSDKCRTDKSLNVHAVLCCPFYRCATWGLVKALEKEAALYSDMLKGLQPQPPSEQWPSLDQRYQQLQECVQQQDQAVQPGQLEHTLSSGLQPSQVGHKLTCRPVCAVLDDGRRASEHLNVFTTQAAAGQWASHALVRRTSAVHTSMLTLDVRPTTCCCRLTMCRLLNSCALR
jgi:hypothetical protein